LLSISPLKTTPFYLDNSAEPALFIIINFSDKRKKAQKQITGITLKTKKEYNMATVFIY